MEICENYLKKPKFFGHLPEKLNFLKIIYTYLKKLKFFENFSRKSNFFIPIHDPHADFKPD